MRREVAIAETEPVGHAVPAHLFEAAERLVANSPATLQIEPAGEAVENGINIGTDVESPNAGVIADIHDDVDVALWNNLHEPAQKFRGAGAAGQNGGVSCHPNILMQASGE